MTDRKHDAASQESAAETNTAAAKSCRPVCPICGGRLLEIRAKLHCSECHTILETCCEGGAQA